MEVVCREAIVVLRVDTSVRARGDERSHQRGQGLLDAINFNHTDNQYFYIHKMFLLS
jgi:hypothetical protein